MIRMTMHVGDLVVNRSDFVVSAIRLGEFMYAGTTADPGAAPLRRIGANTPAIVISTAVGDIRDMRGILLGGELFAVFEAQLALVNRA